MTTARYTITTNENHDPEDAPYIALFVKDVEAASMNTDFIFIETMSRSWSVGNALSELLAIEVDCQRIFEPHFGVLDADYTVECMLVGDTELGMLPAASGRRFFVNASSATIEIGDATMATKDRELVRQAIDEANREPSTRPPAFN